MTEDEIADLRRRAQHCTTHHDACDCRKLAHAEEIMRLDAGATALHLDSAQSEDAAIDTMLALHAQIVVMRPLIEALAYASDLGDCLFPGCKEHAYVRQHAPNCPVTLARALLEKDVT